MIPRTLNRIIAFVVFMLSLAVYVRTMSPTVVFWDVGEFCAAAFSLQVPHPPGAPLFLLLARVSSLIPFVHDIAVRMHALSAIGSALTCMCLYLIVVDLLQMWRGQAKTLTERIIVYGSAAVGALSLAFGRTFWFNAVEAEVYGLSMLFVSIILWLGLRWYERAESDDGSRCILLIAYIVGLSVGVHLLSILAVFPVMLLGYFRHRRFEWMSFAKFSLGALIVFGIIYPGVVQFLPSLLDGEFNGTRSILFTALPIALLVAAIVVAVRSQRRRLRIVNIAALSFLLIVLGYSTYAVVYIRANANPPMNENDPSTVGRLVSYLNREQYGNPPVFDRRYDTDPEKRAAHARYSSDLDYLWRYQVVHMFVRYLGWQFIGSEGDFKEAGVSLKGLYAIPFIVGVLGLWSQWRRQPTIAFILSVMFVIMGVVLALYQNQQEPQPRERDYFYVGAYFVFSLWIAYGVVFLADLMCAAVKRWHGWTAGAVVAAAFVCIPANMLRVNFKEADRTGDYVAWDYSYNLLQSCEKDAVLFTNGDNDTFPLWYLQDVEGVRRDVRLVNLSLANTAWYISQLKHGMPYGTQPVPLSLTDDDINGIQPVQYEPRVMEIPVASDVVQSVAPEERALFDTSVTRSGVLRFFMPSTLQYGNVKALRVQDIVVFDIIRTANWRRPVYFSMTVADDGKAGLRDYMKLCGLAYKLVPYKTTQGPVRVSARALRLHLFARDIQPAQTPQLGFRWRGLQDTTVYLDADTRRLLSNNYRSMFVSLALHEANVPGAMPQAAAVLDRMEEVMPRRVIPMDYRVLFDVASLYNAVGRSDRFRELSEEIVTNLRSTIAQGGSPRLAPYNPYVLLYYTYLGIDRFNEADTMLSTIYRQYATVSGIDEIIGQLRAQLEIRKQRAAMTNKHSSTK